MYSKQIGQRRIFLCVFFVFFFGIARKSHSPDRLSLSFSERFNQTLERQLRKLVSDSPADWDLVIDECVFAYNTSKHASTGFTPFFLMYGR